MLRYMMGLWTELCPHAYGECVSRGGRRVTMTNLYALIKKPCH